MYNLYIESRLEWLNQKDNDLMMLINQICKVLQQQNLRIIKLEKALEKYEAPLKWTKEEQQRKLDKLEELIKEKL